MTLATDPGWHRGDWMQTFTGRRFYPTAPLASDVDIADIAHSLGMLCRYAGHVDRFYSVAEHCVLVSRAVDPDFAFEALLHDATEAYVVDMPRPLKVQLPSYRAVERVVALVIARHFGLPIDHHYDEDVGDNQEAHESPAVKEADTRILLDERNALMSRTHHEWGIDSLEPLGVEIHGWSPMEAEHEYLQRFHELAAYRRES